MNGYLSSMLGASILALGGSILPAASAQTLTPVASLGEGFNSGNTIVNGTSIHYVRGGSGPAVILCTDFRKIGRWFCSDGGRLRCREPCGRSSPPCRTAPTEEWVYRRARYRRHGRLRVPPQIFWM